MFVWKRSKINEKEAGILPFKKNYCGYYELFENIWLLDFCHSLRHFACVIFGISRFIFAFCSLLMSPAAESDKNEIPFV